MFSSVISCIYITYLAEFLNVRFLDDLQEIIGNNWDQILILMGVGFQHIEETLKEKTVHLHEKISRVSYMSKILNNSIQARFWKRMYSVKSPY